jgi:molecular chaperone HscB
MRTISPCTLRFLKAAVSGSASHSGSSKRCLYIASKIPSVNKKVYLTGNLPKWSRTISQSTRLLASSDSNNPQQSLDELLQTRPSSHYDFFPNAIPQGPPPTGSFDIDLSALKRDFLRLQALAHPDRLPPERRAAAQGLSARINEAYRTLQSPLRRAEYLLELRGARVQADEEAVLGEAEGDSEILMEVMEAREEAEEAETEEQISNLRTENNQRIEAVIGKLEEAFKKDELITAKREAVRLRYWVGVEDRLREGNGNH